MAASKKVLIQESTTGGHSETVSATNALLVGGTIGAGKVPTVKEDLTVEWEENGSTTITSNSTLTGAGTVASPLGLANGEYEGQVIRAGALSPSYVNSGNLLNNTIEDNADLALSHFVKGLLIANKGTALTLTIKAATDVAYIADSIITIVNRGAGTLTIQAAAGVSINGEVAGSIELAQYKGGALVRISEDAWVMPNYTAGAAA